MIFTQIRKIVERIKIQTRRIVKPGEHLVWNDDDNHHHFVLTPGGRIKWRVGQDYAVQPGRGYHGVFYDIDTGAVYGRGYEPLNDATRECRFIRPLRIKILSLHYPERLQTISSYDVIAEGMGGDTSRADYERLWDNINKQPGTRWHDNPNVWVIKFEVLSNE